MTTLLRYAMCLTCAVAALRLAAGAQGGPTEANGAAAAELAALLAAFPTWSTSVSAAASFGYNDNLLLSFASEERSPFVRGSVDFLLLRIPSDQFDFSFYGEAVGTNYTSGKTVRDDAKVWLQAEPAYRIGEKLKLALPVTGYYYDQVFDVSDTDVERVVAELEVTGGMVGPMVRWDFRRAWFLEAQGVAQRKRYDDRVNDGDIGEGVLRLGWARGRWLEAAISGAQRWRNFDSRTQYTAAGRGLPETRLKIAEREGELRFDITWDRRGKWETTTRFTVVEYRDNGSGYFNYSEQKVAQEVEWNSERWQVRLGGSAGRVDFDVQTVGLGIDPPARLRDEYLGELHLGRRLSDRWILFGAYVWERCRSNDPIASYEVNEGLLGLRWSWE